jgi:hypothetical protein
LQSTSPKGNKVSLGKIQRELLKSHNFERFK